MKTELKTQEKQEKEHHMTINSNRSYKDIQNLLELHDPSGMAIAMYDAAWAFGEKHLKPINATVDQANAFPGRELWLSMGEQGFLGMTAPEQYGGMAAGYLAHYAISEALSYHCGSVGLSYIAHSNLCVNQITLNGSDAQKERYLPKLISGEYVGALAMSEPNAGSDVMSMTTRATKVDGGYVLNGSKTWITNGGDADVVIVYAADGDAKTAFLVEKDTDGFSTGLKIDKMGMRGSETSPLYFDNCFVPDDNILGKPGKGTSVLMKGLNYERLMLSAGALGLALASLDYTLNYGEERKQFGRPLITNQGYAWNIGSMRGDIDMVRNYNMAAARFADNTKLTNGMAANAFLQSSTIADRVTNECIVLCGGVGYTKDLPLEQNHRDAKLYQIGGGAREVQKDIIARDTSPVYDSWVKIQNELTKQIDFSDPCNPKIKPVL